MNWRTWLLTLARLETVDANASERALGSVSFGSLFG